MTFVPRALAGAAALIALGIAGCGDAAPDTEPPSDTEAPSDPDAETSPDPDPGSSADGVVDLPGDDQPGDDSPDGMTGGVLAADDDGCVWLIDPPVKDEPFEPEVALFWPADHSFDTSTREILDPAGEVVASIGDRVGLGGGETPHRAPDWPERCDVADRVWSVSSIELRTADNGSAPSEPEGPHDAAARLRPDLMEIEPATAAPDDVLSVRFPEGTARGVAFVLEEQTGSDWELRYVLVAGSDSDGAAEWWTPDDAEGRGWDDVGVDGPGPDLMEVPTTATPGDYRLCTANAGDNVCAALEVAE